MKWILPILFSTFFTTLSYGQFGLTAGYRFNDAPDWTFVSSSGQAFDGETIFLGDGFSVGIDYWFRLKSMRIEFLPELNYSRFEHEIGSFGETSSNFFSLFLHTNFYLFDLYGDCDCPTWSKQGTFFQKGFFLRASPGFTWMNNRAAFTIPAGDPLDSRVEAEAEDQVFSLGAAAGLDIGVSDLLTITPVIGLRYYFPATWEELSRLEELPTIVESIESEKSSIWQFYGGIRFGFRFDN